MNKVIKSTLAGVFAFAIIGTSVLPSAQTISTLFDDTSISASAATSASCCSFDKNTGVLTLSGQVNKNEVRKYAERSSVCSVVCKPGTVFPADCMGLFDSFESSTMDLSNADTSKVETMNGMFCWCSKLRTLNLSGWKNTKVTDMWAMFCHCRGLYSLNLKGFQTPSVKLMPAMFANCISLTSLDVSSFDTSKVEDMTSMFYNCNKLTTLNLSNFNTANVTETAYMFEQCSKLNTIFVSSKWTTANTIVSSDMFKGCSALKGANGTQWTSSYITKTYARVDKKGQKGYLSLLGDVDFDGKVTEDDAFLVLDEYTNVMSGKAHILNANQLKVADVDFNGKVELEDAQYILNYTANSDWRKIVK